MLSTELENSLNQAVLKGREARHEFVTVEHLFWALLNNRLASKVLRACGADINILRQQLEEYLSEQVPQLTEGDDQAETQPSIGFQRVIQRAVLHVQSSRRQRGNRGQYPGCYFC